SQIARVDVVLIQTDADVVRIDLDPLAERILQAPADGDGAAQESVGIRELLPPDRAGGIFVGARFIDDYVGQVRVKGWRVKSRKRRAESRTSRRTLRSLLLAFRSCLALCFPLSALCR